MGDLMVLLVLGMLVCMSVFYLWRNRGKNGCGGDCTSCVTSCHVSENLKKARTAIRKAK